MSVRRWILFVASLLLASLSISAQEITLPLWPNGTPEPYSGTAPELDARRPTDHPAAGRPFIHLTNVSKLTLTVYAPPPSMNSGTAVLVFPGGGYNILAYDLEGTEVCTWLNSIGVTCVLVKYRVPFADHFPENPADLEDAQQAMRITRAHAAEWHIDAARTGALGFSAGAHLVVMLSNHSDFKRIGESEAESKISAKPDFALVIYPGYLASGPNLSMSGESLNVTAKTPPTFLIQAENDPVQVENAIVYFLELKKAVVPAEMHIFPEGGHGYGLRPTAFPVSHWPTYAEIWLHTIKMLNTITASK